MKIIEAKQGHRYGIGRIKAVVKVLGIHPAGPGWPEDRIKVLNEVTGNELILQGTYQVDGEVNAEKAEELLSQNETVIQQRFFNSELRAKMRVYQSNKSGNEGTQPRVSPPRGEGKIALIEAAMKAGGKTLDQIVADVAAKLGIEADGAILSLRSTAGVRMSRMRRDGYAVVKDKSTGVITVSQGVK